MHDDEIWDEDRWEAFLRETDRRMDRRLQLFYRFSAEFPRPATVDETAHRQWIEKLRQYFVENGFGADDGFIRMFEPISDEDVPEWMLDSSAVDAYEADDDEPPTFESLEVYDQAMTLAADVLRWTNALPIDDKDSTLVHFCAAVTQIPANLAKGSAFGTEREMIGGFIACTKRALGNANEGLDHLRDLRSAAYMDDSAYHRLYERLFEVRNAVALYVQELRERFDLGID
jgi:four helix bundle protein